jgi:hypothetical protein
MMIFDLVAMAGKQAMESRDSLKAFILASDL